MDYYFKNTLYGMVTSMRKISDSICEVTDGLSQLANNLNIENTTMIDTDIAVKNIENNIDQITNSFTDEIDKIRNNMHVLYDSISELRTEMVALTEKPKPKSDLEIFEAIFDNSDFPLLQNNVFDFNINI